MAKEFNEQKHFDELHKIGEGVASALMLCEGLSYANGALMDDQFRTAATGAFRSMALALGATYDIFSEVESDFYKAFEAKYPYERDGAGA